MSEEPDGASKAVGYELIASLEWTERAYQMLDDGTLAAAGFLTDGVGSAHVWGSCPRCEDRIDVRTTASAVVRVTRGGGSEDLDRVVGAPTQPRSLTVDVICGCGRAHSGAPEGKTGCGVNFRIPAPVTSTPIT
jgi:hypothetical protein